MDRVADSALHAQPAGLAENRCLVRRPNGAQLMQVGEQEIALGAKFRARIVLDVEVRCSIPYISVLLVPRAKQPHGRRTAGVHKHSESVPPVRALAVPCCWGQRPCMHMGMWRMTGSC